MIRKKEKGGRLSLEKKDSIHGYLFMLPWLFGMLVFFLVPMIKALLWALCDIKIVKNGTVLNFVGFKNFHFMLFGDADFVRNVTESLTSLLVNILVILTFSMFVGVLLAQKFRGKALMRGLFFLPVVISSSIVVKIVKENVFQAGNAEEAHIFQTDAITQFIGSLGIENGLITQFTGFAARIFDLTWQSGLQVLLFLAAIQAIPSSYREVCEIEGANAWERFWYVTFPVILPTTLIAFIYTIIDNFTSVNNQVMQGILKQFDNMEYGAATAAAVIYFMVIMAFITIVFLCTRKRVFR